MATSKRVWNPAHHPRDSRGRFTKSATRVLKASDAKRAKAAVAGFAPKDLGPAAANGAEWIKKQAAATAAADDAVARYFAGGWKTTHQELRTKKDAATDPDVVAIDKAMAPLSDDVMLERRVSLKMFAHIPLEQLQGMKVRDAAYQPTALQGSQGEAPDGMVTVHMAVPAGTRAIVNPDTGAIVLDRDTETAISRVEPNGRGGYDLYGVVIPKVGAVKPGRPAGEPAQVDDQDTPDAPAPAAADVVDQDDDQTTAGGSAAAGGTTPPRKRAGAPARPGVDAEQDEDQDDEQTAQSGTSSTAGTRAPARRRPAAQDDDETAGGAPRAGDDDDVQGADAAATLDELEQQVEQGRPVTAAVADLETGAYARIEGEDQYGARIRLTGYVTARPALVTVKKNRRAKTGVEMLSAYVTETPNGAAGWRGQVLVTPDATAEILPEPVEFARRPNVLNVDARPVATIADVQRNDYVTVAGLDGSNREVTATGYAGAVVSMDSKRAMIGLTEYPDGTGTGPRLFVKPDSPVTQERPPADPNVVLWKDAAGRPVSNPNQARIVRGQVVRDTEREQQIKARIAELSPDTADAPSQTEPAAGSKLAELTPVDRAALAVLVEDQGPGIFQSPLTGRSFADVGRYVSEAGTAKTLTDRYGSGTVWAAAEEHARANPDVLARTVDEVQALQAARAQRASTHAAAAAAATKSRDYSTARAEIDAGELVDPTHRENFRGWDAMRAIVARVEQKNAAGAADASTAGTGTPAGGSIDSPVGPARQRPLSSTTVKRGGAIVYAGDQVSDVLSSRKVMRDGAEWTETLERFRTDGTLSRRTRKNDSTLVNYVMPADRTVPADLTNPYASDDTTPDTDPLIRAIAGTAGPYGGVPAAAGTEPYAGPGVKRTPGAAKYPDGAPVEVRMRNFDKPGFPEEWRAGLVVGARDTGDGTWDITVQFPDSTYHVTRIGPRGGTKSIRPAEGDVPAPGSTAGADATPAPTGLPVTDPAIVSPLGEDLDVPPPGADRLDPEVAQPTRNRWEDHGRPDRVIWFGDGPRPKKRGELATLTQNGTGRNATIMVRGEGSDSDLLRRQNITDRMWIAPVDAPATAPADAPNADVSTAGTSTPEVDPDEISGARIGDRITRPVDELLAEPTIGPSHYSDAAEARTWPAELSVPDVAQTLEVDGRQIAIVRYRTITMPTTADTPTLGWTDQFYAVPADAAFRPLRMSHLTSERHGQPVGSAAAGVTSTTAHPAGKYRNMHIASGKTATAAASGARAKVEKDTARTRHTPAALANVGVHDQADFDRLDPNAEINPGDLVVLRSFNKLRTGVATKVTANKVDALVSTPTGAYDTWYGTAQKGVGVRLLRRTGTTTPGRTLTPDERADDVEVTDAAGKTIGYAQQRRNGEWVAQDAGHTGTRTRHTTPDEAAAAIRARAQAAADSDAAIRRANPSTPPTGREADPAYRAPYERGWRDSARSAPAALERAAVRNEPEPYYDGFRDFEDEREKYATARDRDAADSTAGTDAPAAPALDAAEERAAVAGRVFAQGQLDGVTPDDTRFRMRRARVGNRELDVYDEQGNPLGILHQEPGRDGWLTLPRHGRAGVTAPTFAAAVASLRAGEVSPEATPALPSPAAPAVDPGQRRDQIADSMAGAQAAEIAEAVDAAVDKAEPADPVDARKAALEAKRAELDKARKAVETVPMFGGSSRRKSFGVRVDANIRRTAEAFRNVERLEREVKALERPAAPTAPAGGWTREQLEGARVIRTRVGWHEVVKVNSKSVKVKAAPGMDDLVPYKRIIDARDTNGAKVDAPAAATPETTADVSTAGTGTPAPDAPAAGAGDPDAVSITRQADPFALVGNTGGDDLDAAFGPTTPAAPAVDMARIAVDDEVRVAGQWATVTAKTDGQIRVRFAGDRLALVSPADIRQHRAAVRVEDMFGGTTTFVAQDRATIGLATRADVGRTRGQQDVQQVSMFDVADQVQLEGQTALLDMFMQAPTAEAPVSAQTLLPADAPEPTRVDVPDDLSGWTDEQLAGLFAEVVAQAEYDEDGTLRITAEWDRREQEMSALLGMVPEDLTTLDDDSAAALFADLTAHHGTMDSDVVARLEADLDRRDAEHQAGLADLEAKRALLARDPRTYADDDELKAALDAAGELDDESALDRVLAEYERRDEQERVEAARVAMEAQAAAVAEQAAAAEAAAAESRRIAAEAAAVEHSQALSGLLAARAAGYYGGVSAGDAETAAQHVDPAELARILDGTEIRDASLEQKVRILYAAGRADAAEEFAGWSTDKLFAELTKKTLGRGGPGFDRERADRAGREWSRRKLADRLQDDETSLHRYAYELLRREDVAGLTDAQLAAAPAMMAVYDGPFTDEIPSRMRVLDDEIKRRMDVAAAKVRKAEAGPAGPARVSDPVGAMNDIERWVTGTHVRSSYGWRGGDAADRWDKSRRIVLGLPDDADARTVNAAWKTDPRPLPERAATQLAWYRHLGELADVDASDSAVRDWMVGPADDPDLPDVPEPLPPANVAKPADVWSAMRAQAREDAEAGDFRAAVRLAMAQNRAYGVRIVKPDTATIDTWQGVNGRHFGASSGDNRTEGQKAALFIAEFRRLAEEDGVDPDDALRYGPHDKGTVRKVKIGRVTVTTNPATDARVAAMIAQGHDQASAYALVYGLDEGELRRAEADAAIRSSGKTLTQAYREQYESMVAAAYEAAETGTRGHLLNEEGKKLWLAGKLSAIELFSGPSSKAYRYASEELQRWWGEHPPPRMTFAEFKQMAQGDARTALASATQNAKGSEFS